MANQVIKKDGSREAFNPKKIRNSIRGAAKRSRVAEKQREKLVKEVAQAVMELAEGKEEIATSEIRKEILNQLDRLAPKVAANWRKYEEKKK